MANYDAQINIIVGGQRNLQNLTGQLNEIESTIEQIDRRWRAATAALQRARIRLNVAGTTQPRGEGGRFARDPDRQARFAAYADRRRASVESLLSRRAIARTRAEATATRDLIGQNERLISQTERRIALESRLNSANDLFQRRLQQLSRGGGGRNLTEELRAQVQSIQNAYNAAGGGASRNLRLVQSLATELGRVVERQNEFNRLRALSSKGFEAGRRLQERIDDIAGSIPSRRVRAARGLATEAIAASYRGDQQAYSEAIRRATAATARLERESRQLARTINAQEREISRIAKIAPRSPILGGSNFPGSPRAIQEQRRLREEELRGLQKGFPSSPILGGPRMTGSPKWIAAQERAAKAAASNAERALRESQAGYPASPIGGLASLTGSPKWIAAQKRAAAVAERALASRERAAKAAANDAERELRESQKGYPASPIAGTASMMGSPKWIAAQQRAKSAAEKALRAQERSAKIAEKIANTEAEKALRESQKGYPSSPIAGAATMAGSPKWIAAQEKARLAAEKRAAAARASEEKVARAQKRAAVIAERAANKALIEAQKGYPSSPIMGGAAIEGSPRWKKAQELAAKKLESAAIAAGRAADKALREAQRGFPSSPILGTATMVGSPKWNAAQERLARSGGSGMGGSIGQAFRAGGPGAALASLGSPQRLASQQASATLLAEKLNNLEIKNVNTASERARLQQIINELNQKDLQLSDELLNNFDIQLNSIRDYIRLQNQVVANDRAREAAAKKGGAGGAGETGFAKTLKTFSESLEESRGYFGKQGPAQAIDQIVRAFRGDAGTSGKLGAGANVVDTLVAEANAGVPDAKKAGKALGAAIEDGLNDGLDIASPSGVALRAMMNVVNTLVKTAQSGAAKVGKAVRDLIDPSDFDWDDLKRKARTQIGAEGGLFSIGAFSPFPSEGLISGYGGSGIPPSGVSGSGAPGDPEDFARRVSQATTAEALLGLDELRNVRQLSSRELQLLSAAIEEVQQNLRPATADFDRFNNQITQLRGRIGIEQAARNPEAGFLARRRIGPRAGRAISEGLVGGAFPLLFGQGLGASVFGGLGGAAGGFAGGGLGFGLSLVGTGLGTAVDTLSTNIRNLATSLKEPTQALEAMKTAGLRVTPELEDTVKRIEALGFASSAQNLVLKELERQIGAKSVMQLQALNSEQKRLESEWQRLSATIVSDVLPALTGLVSFLGDLGRGINSIRSIELPPWLAKALEGTAIATTYLASPATAGLFGGIRGLRQRGREVAANQQGGVGATPEQTRQQQLAPFQINLDALTARQSILELGKTLTDQVRSAAREQEDLDRQRYDLIESYEKSISDIRLNVSRRIQQEELNNLARQNEIYSKQGDIRLQQLRNENAAVSESLRGNEIGQQLFDIVAQYTEQQLETENEIANRRRALQAELKSVEIEIEQYKIDIAKQVSDLNISTAKQVEQIQLNVARRQQDAAESRFGIEKDIAIARIEVERILADQRRADLKAAQATEKDPTRSARFSTAIQAYDRLLQESGPGSFNAIKQTISNTKAPAAPSFAGFTPGGGVSTAGVESAVAAGNQLRLRLEELSKVLDSLIAAGKFNEFNSQLMNLADQGMMAAVKEFKELSASLEVFTGGSAGLGALLPQFEALDEAQKKILGSEAVQKSPQKAELEKLIPLYIRLAKVNMQAAETYGFFNSAISENLNEITSLKEEINNLLAGTTAYEQALASLTARGLSPASEEAQKLLASAQELDRLRDKAEILNNIRDAATGFSDSLRGLVEQFVELKDAGEAVKAFSEELGKKSLSFVLDLAFKPIEDAMQKQFIAFADMLGVDVKPEELKQLTELQKLNNQADSINKKIEPIVGSLAAIQKQAEAEALARSQQGQAVVPLNYVGRDDQSEYYSNVAKVARSGLSAYYDEPSIRAQTQVYKQDLRNKIYSYPQYSTEQKDAIYARIVSVLEEQERLRLEAIRKMTGQGGPDTIIPGVDVPPADRNLPSPGALKSLTEGAAGAAQKLPEVINKTTEGVEKSTQGLQVANASWAKGLGQAVTALAGASTAVLGIAGGIQQIKSGGTYGTLMGLAGIFGGIASAASMFGTGGAFAGAFGGGGGATPSLSTLSSQAAMPPVFGRATGGPVLGGSPYLVGEQGPELFIPNGSGMIIPNRSTKVEGAGSPFAATSQQVSANGERAMAANLDNSPIKVESRIINGVEYVTMDQLNEATRRAEVRGAERGKSLAISSLQNSVKTRKRVGV